MKKRLTSVVLLLVVALFAVQFTFPVAIAAVRSEPCQEGNHTFELVDIEYWYGGQRRFTVSSCEYASYPHEHYYITCTIDYTYVCSTCGYTKVISQVVDDNDLGPICTLHDCK